jgi:aromatic-amino-acid transaminase
LFEKFTAYAGDPILSLQQTYAQDERPEKVNLSIGLYYDDAGRIPHLRAVQLAQAVVRKEEGPCVYQPMAGAANYRRAVQALLFGEAHPKVAAGHVATIQTIGGSGALKVGSDLLKQHFSDSQVWISDPSWDNHAAIFEGSGFTVKRYPYFDIETRGVDFAAMSACLRTLPARTIVLFHPCCHNPTGADLTRAQWDEIIEMIRSRDLIPFLDIAYQGLGEGVDEDCYAIRAMTDAGISFLISNSFSKTFSLYGERCGGLSVVCQNANEAARVLGQMELTVRRNYSSPPTNGGQLVAAVLLDPYRKSIWLSEVSTMRERINLMRQELHDVLRSERPDADFGYLLTQRGMFSYTGLSIDRVRDLRTRSGIYLVDSGRLCLAGLNAGNVQRVGHALAQAMQ